jgi:hypothetical protein
MFASSVIQLLFVLFTCVLLTCSVSASSSEQHITDEAGINLSQNIGSDIKVSVKSFKLWKGTSAPSSVLHVADQPAGEAKDFSDIAGKNKGHESAVARALRARGVHVQQSID